MKTDNKKIITAVLVILLVLAGAGMYKLQKDSEEFKFISETHRLENDSLLALNQLLINENLQLFKKNAALTDRVVFLNDLVDKSNMKSIKKEMDMNTVKKISQ